MAESSGGHGSQPNRFFARVMADQQYEKGRELEQQGSWERALAAYRRACGLDPSSVLYLVARGRICHARGICEEAEACYEAALRLRPADPVALFNRAQLFAARGELEEARASLTRIVSGEAVQDGAGRRTDPNGVVGMLGERAAPVFCTLGEIALRREEYGIAAVHFRKALEAAAEHRYARAALGALGRFAEFEQPVQPDGGIDPKIAMYAYGGAMVLGMPGDDGISLPRTPGLGFESLEEVAGTLARPVRLFQRLRRSFDCIAPLDSESQPIAIALAGALGARVLDPDELPARSAVTLGVTATGADARAISARQEALAERCQRVVTYGVGLLHPIWEYSPAPDVLSMPVRLEFPWNRGEASAAEHAEAYGAELAERLTSVLARDDDATAAAQVAWYRRHPALRVGSVGLADPIAGAGARPQVEGALPLLLQR